MSPKKLSPNKLTDTQLVLLSAAAQREDGAIQLAHNLIVFRRFDGIASNPAIGFGAGGAPGLAGNVALSGLLTKPGIRLYVNRLILGTSAGAIVGGAGSTSASAENMLLLVDELDRKGAVDFARWEVLCGRGLVRGRQIRNAIKRGFPGRALRRL